MAKLKRCWRCKKRFTPNTITDNCLYCGYEQDIKHVIYVKIKQAKHNRWEGDRQSDATDPWYWKKKRK